MDKLVTVNQIESLDHRQGLTPVARLPARFLAWFGKAGKEAVFGVSIGGWWFVRVGRSLGQKEPHVGVFHE